MRKLLAYNQFREETQKTRYRNTNHISRRPSVKTRKSKADKHKRTTKFAKKKNTVKNVLSCEKRES